MRKHQLGLSLVGTMFVAVAIIGAIILGMRMVPIYAEYFAVKKALAAIATSSEATSPEAIRAAFERKAPVEDIQTVKKSDLTILKVNGRWEISAEWQRTLPLVHNVSLLFVFAASSSGDVVASE